MSPSEALTPALATENHVSDGEEQLGDILGDPNLHGSTISLSSILPLVDLVAGRCAFAAVRGDVVTGAFDHISLLAPLYHGDVVSARARVVAYGNASLLMRVNVVKHVFQRHRPHPLLAVRCYATFVALDHTSRKPRLLPSEIRASVSPSTTEAGLPAEYKQQRKLFSMATGPARPSGSASKQTDTEPCPSTTKPRHARIEAEATQICIRKQFMPSDQNVSGAIFGGAIMHTLETTAVACVNRWCAPRLFHTVSIRAFAFLKPVQLMQVLQVRARIVAVTHTYVSVVVRSFVGDDLHRGHGKAEHAHHAVFHLAPMHGGLIDFEGLHMCVDADAVERCDDADYHVALALPPALDVIDAWRLQCGEQ